MPTGKTGKAGLSAIRVIPGVNCQKATSCFCGSALHTPTWFASYVTSAAIGLDRVLSHCVARTSDPGTSGLAAKIPLLLPENAPHTRPPPPTIREAPAGKFGPIWLLKIKVV